MNQRTRRYTFEAGVDTNDVSAALMLALWGVEGLHGPAAVLLDATYYFDPTHRVCLIHEATPVGRDFNRIFVGFLLREMAAECFTVEQVDEWGLVVDSARSGELPDRRSAGLLD
jgi:hypothetical protein